MHRIVVNSTLRSWDESNTCHIGRFIIVFYR